MLSSSAHKQTKRAVRTKRRARRLEMNTIVASLPIAGTFARLLNGKSVAQLAKPGRRAPVAQHKLRLTSWQRLGRASSPSHLSAHLMRRRRPPKAGHKAGAWLCHVGVAGAALLVLHLSIGLCAGPATTKRAPPAEALWRASRAPAQIWLAQAALTSGTAPAIGRPLFCSCGHR